MRATLSLWIQWREDNLCVCSSAPERIYNMEGESGPFSVLFFFVPLKEKGLIYHMTTLHGKIKFPLGKGTDTPTMTMFLHLKGSTIWEREWTALSSFQWQRQWQRQIQWFREHPQRAILETWGILSEWWDMNWSTKRQWQRERQRQWQWQWQRQWQRQIHLQIHSENTLKEQS